MSSYQLPRVPGFAPELDPDIVQLHSSAYRNPGQLAAGDVLLVGRGNSGAEIARELTLAGHRVAMAGPDTGNIPVRPGTFAARLVLPILFRVIGKHILTTGTPIGRAVRPKMLSSATPLIRVKPKDLVALGVEQLPRVSGVRGRASSARGRPHHRCSEPDLVHRILDRLLVDRRGRVRPARSAATQPRHRRGRTGTLLRWPRIPVRAFIGDGARRWGRRALRGGSHCAAHALAGSDGSELGLR